MKKIAYDDWKKVQVAAMHLVNSKNRKDTQEAKAKLMNILNELQKKYGDHPRFAWRKSFRTSKSISFHNWQNCGNVI